MKSEKARQGEVTTADPLALGKEIARLAHSYWEADSRPEGSDMGYWLRAERSVLAAHGLLPLLPPGGGEVEEY